MRKTLVAKLVLLLALTAATAFAEDKRWVSSDGTTLKSQASVSAGDVKSLPVGSELTVLEDGGRWIRVRTSDGTEGWVYAGRISDTAPAAEVTDGGAFGGALQGSQIETAKADSARSIRGLSPETAAYAKQRGTPEAYKKDLDKVLARKVSPQDLKAFLREGKIGEYAQ